MLPRGFPLWPRTSRTVVAYIRACSPMFGHSRTLRSSRAAQVPVPALPHGWAAGGAGEGVWLRAGGVQRRVGSSQVALPARSRVIEAADRGEEDSRASVAGRGVGGRTTASLGGPEHRVPQFLRIDYGQAEGRKSCTATVPVTQGQSAVDSVHSCGALCDHVWWEVAVTEDRRRERGVVAGAAVTPVERDSDQRRGGPVFCIVCGGGDRGIVAAGRVRGRNRLGLGDVRGAIQWCNDRLAKISAASRAQAAKVAESSLPQAERLCEPRKGADKGCQGTRQSGRYPAGLGAQTLYGDHPRQPSGVRRRLVREGVEPLPVSEVRSRRRVGHVHPDAGGEGSSAWAVLRRDRQILSVIAAVLYVRPGRRPETAVHPRMDVPLRCRSRSGPERGQEHSRGGTRREAKRLWSAGRTGLVPARRAEAGTHLERWKALAGISGSETERTSNHVGRDFVVRLSLRRLALCHVLEECYGCPIDE